MIAPPPSVQETPTPQDVAFGRAIVFLDRVKAGKGVPPWKRRIIPPAIRDWLDPYTPEGEPKPLK